MVLLLATVAFIYSNNFTLMLAPERWLELYHSNASGWNLNWSEPSLLPRYLHFVLGALAVSGLGLVVMGLRKQEDEYRQWLTEQGILAVYWRYHSQFRCGILVPGEIAQGRC